MNRRGMSERRLVHASQDGPDAGHQLARLEGLGDVVVGTHLQAGHAVDDVVASGEHDHGAVDAVGAQLSQDLEAGATGQHHVEDEHVGPSGTCQLEARSPSPTVSTW